GEAVWHARADRRAVLRLAGVTVSPGACWSFPPTPPRPRIVTGGAVRDGRRSAGGVALRRMFGYQWRIDTERADLGGAAGGVQRFALLGQCFGEEGGVVVLVQVPFTGQVIFVEDGL